MSVPFLLLITDSKAVFFHAESNCRLTKCRQRESTWFPLSGNRQLCAALSLSAIFLCLLWYLFSFAVLYIPAAFLHCCCCRHGATFMMEFSHAEVNMRKGGHHKNGHTAENFVGFFDGSRSVFDGKRPFSDFCSPEVWTVCKHSFLTHTQHKQRHKCWAEEQPPFLSCSLIQEESLSWCKK